MHIAPRHARASRPLLTAIARDTRGTATVEYVMAAAFGLVVALALMALGGAFYTSDQTNLDALTANAP